MCQILMHSIKLFQRCISHKLCREQDKNIQLSDMFLSKWGFLQIKSWTGEKMEPIKGISFIIDNLEFFAYTPAWISPLFEVIIL